MVYDDERALHRRADAQPRPRRPIQAPMGRRDGIEEQAEYLLVSLDTFLDRRTAYAFGVTATGVRMDRYHPQDDEADLRRGLQPGLAGPDHHRGGQLDRGAVDSVLPAPLQRAGGAGLGAEPAALRAHAQRDGLLGAGAADGGGMGLAVRRPGGHRGAAAPRSASRCCPTSGGAATVNGNRDRRNPFDDGRNLSSRAGVDLKVGIGPNLTLDATFNPDFGQVEADPSEVNLTANETFFVEKRPFFTEGARLLNMVQATNFFYSRRIGATPETPRLTATSWTIRRRRRSSARPSSPAACARGRRSAFSPRSPTRIRRSSPTSAPRSIEQRARRAAHGLRPDAGPAGVRRLGPRRPG